MNAVPLSVLKSLSFITLLSFVCACGGGSGDEDSLRSSTDSNVARSGEVSASFNEDDADLVNDGVTSGLFWGGNIASDFVQIDFGELKSVSSVRVFTNATGFDSMNPDKWIELSEDGLNWMTTAQPADGDLACGTYSSDADSIYCELATRFDAQYIRFRLSAVSPGTIRVYEMVVSGR